MKQPLLNLLKIEGMRVSARVAVGQGLASTEPTPGAGQYDHPCVRILSQPLQTGVEFQQQGLGKRIQSLGPVQRDMGAPLRSV